MLPEEDGMCPDVRADIHHHVARLDELPQKLHFEFGEFPIQVERPPDELIVRMEQHWPIAARHQARQHREPPANVNGAVEFSVCPAAPARLAYRQQLVELALDFAAAAVHAEQQGGQVPLPLTIIRLCLPRVKVLFDFLPLVVRAAQQPDQ